VIFTASKLGDSSSRTATPDTNTHLKTRVWIPEVAVSANAVHVQTDATVCANSVFAKLLQVRQRRSIITPAKTVRQSKQEDHSRGISRCSNALFLFVIIASPALVNHEWESDQGID
jgi:hypothetical protein